MFCVRKYLNKYDLRRNLERKNGGEKVIKGTLFRWLLGRGDNLNV